MTTGNKELTVRDVIKTAAGIYAVLPNGDGMIFPLDVIVDGLEVEGEGVIIVAGWYVEKYNL